MPIALPELLRGFLGLTEQRDEHLLGGAAAAAVRTLGVSQPVLARFKQDVAVLCPDLLHETQVGLGRG